MRKLYIDGSLAMSARHDTSGLRSYHHWIAAACCVWLAPLCIGCGERPGEANHGDASVAGGEQLLEQISSASRRLSHAVGQSVVRIVARQASEKPFATDEIVELFGATSDPTLVGQGSGVIVSRQGEIVTNYHVIKNAAQIDVFWGDKAPYRGLVVGFDALTDLAVIKIDPGGETLPAATWGSSDDLEVGEFVWAVGTPYGLARSISFGILSAKDRQGLTENFLHDFLQTDAAVNPGNSGGPLVNSRGEVIGINTAIIGQSYGGISFAIPSSTARTVFEKIRTTGRVTRGWIGVSLDVVSRQRARELGLDEAAGAFVAAVSSQANSPAQKAGFQAGDVIVAWDDVVISSPVMLARRVAQTPVSQSVTVTLVRDKRPLKLDIVVQERP